MLLRVGIAALAFMVAPQLLADEGASRGELFETLSALDAAMFDAFNRCADPEQLEKHGSYFAPDVEFYHDTGGVTWNREAMLANTATYACGKYRRERVAGSLRVYPIKDFGAIWQGTHRFCGLVDGRCEGVAEFTIVWWRTAEGWVATRVLSYGHRVGVEAPAVGDRRR